MNEAKNESAKIEGFNGGALNENNSCRDMTLVNDDESVADGIVQLANKKEHIDEP